MANTKDPTIAIRKKAGSYAGVDEGKACTQSSFKTGGKSFLFIGEQGGRYKAMFKLSDSIPDAQALAVEQPEDYQVGKTAWVTVRFSVEQPIPAKIWKKWLDESYQLSANATGKKSPRKKAAKKKAGGTKKIAKKGRGKSS